MTYALKAMSDVHSCARSTPASFTFYVSLSIAILIAETIQLVMGPAARLACKTAQLLRHGLRVLSRRIANASVHAIGNIMLDILELAMFKPFVYVAQLFRYAWFSAQYFYSVMYCCRRFGVCATARAHLRSLLRSYNRLGAALVGTSYTKVSTCQVWRICSRLETMGITGTCVFQAGWPGGIVAGGPETHKASDQNFHNQANGCRDG